MSAPSVRRPLHALERRARDTVKRHPRVHVAMLDLLGATRRPPRPGVYFLCWHTVPPSQVRQFDAVLAMLSEHGRFVSWSDGLETLRTPGHVDEPRFCLSFDDGDRSWVDVVAPALTARALPATFFVVTSLVDAPGRDSMRWQDCRALSELGMNIGSHSATHRPLAELDDATAWAELAGSKAALEDQLGVPVLDFCAPYGQPGSSFHPERDPQLAAAAGYRSFATTVRGRMLPGDSAYGVKRMMVDSGWATAAVRGLLRA